MKEKLIEAIICAAAGLVAFSYPVQAAESPAAADLVYTTTYVNARTYPKVTADSYAFTFVPNEELTRVVDGDGWDLVAYNGQNYYICDKYLSEIEKEDNNSASDFKYRGVIKWGGYRWTWYTDIEYPSSNLNIPGIHYDEDGYICDEDGYICLASSSIARYSIVDTPLGKQGKVYDYCPTRGVVDVYTHWR